MARHFMLYWRLETVEWHLAHDYLLENAGSNQLDHASPGDTLWIVTTGEADSLGLAGRLVVGEVVSLDEARRRLGVDKLWPSRYHALAAPGTTEPMRGVSLLDVAGQLRFDDAAASELTIIDDRVQLEELTQMRVLSAESVSLLTRAWSPSGVRQSEWAT